MDLLLHANTNCSKMSDELLKGQTWRHPFSYLDGVTTCLLASCQSPDIVIAGHTVMVGGANATLEWCWCHFLFFHYKVFLWSTIAQAFVKDFYTMRQIVSCQSCFHVLCRSTKDDFRLGKKCFCWDPLEIRRPEEATTIARFACLA